MNKDSCFELGVIVKPHGLKGEVEIFLDVDFPEDYLKLESVLVEIQHKLVPFFIKTIQLGKGKKALVVFEDVNSFETAESLRTSKLFLPLAKLPKLESHQFYFHEVIGYQVNDKRLGEIGIVTDFNAASAQTIMVFEYKGKEILAPVLDETVYKVDHKEKQVLVDLPEGLVEIYLEE